MKAKLKSSLPLALQNLSGKAQFYQNRAGEHAKDAAITKLGDYMTRLEKGLTALEQLRRNKSPLDTNPAHVKKCSDAARALTAKFSREHDDVLDSLARRKGSIPSEIKARLKVKHSPELPEIRAVLRQMGTATRTETIAAGITAGDPSIMSVIFETENALLLGVDAQRLNRWREAAARQHAPDLLEFEKLLDEALTATLDIIAPLAGIPDHVAEAGEVVEIIHGAEAADAAARNFQAAVGVAL